jgi:2-oxoglutarate/2-oxoacid ferredoxin oxidoreductase subunit beta
MIEKTAVEKNFRTGVNPVWCAGCGNFGILGALSQRALPNLGIPNHEIMVVSGIGCSSRMPAYIDTYGINSIHGRATVIAQGVKIARPELTVIVVGGDGDFFSIGAGHLPHMVRRNMDITCIMADNFAYALTKGQLSPTTPRMAGNDARFFPKQYTPPVDPMLNMISYSFSTQASFIAQGIAHNIHHLARLIEMGIGHRGFSFINVLTPCITYNPPELFQTIKSKAVYLKDEASAGMTSISEEEMREHDSSSIDAAMELAQTTVLEKPHLGVFYRGRVSD